MSIPGITQAATETTRQVRDLALLVARVVAFIGVCLAGYLAYASTAAGGNVAGCSDTASGCSQILKSRWAIWITTPVALPAFGVYLVALFSTWIAAATTLSIRRVAWTLLATIAVLTGGTAIWFIGLQLVSLKAICWYCLALHSCGLYLACFIAWRLPQEIIAEGASLSGMVSGAVVGAIGVAALVVGQLVYVPDMQIVRTTHAPSEIVLKPATRSADHPWPHRRLRLLDGTSSFDIYDFPVIGDRDASMPLVEVFDYTCSNCRELYKMFEGIRGSYGDDLTFVIVPIAINANCNEFVKTTADEHASACDLARLAIAVWQSKPEAFETFHHWMMQGSSPPTPKAAETEAARLVGSEALAAALSSESVNKQLEENSRIYAMARDDARGDTTIPKLLFEHAVANGLPSTESRLRHFLESEVGLKRK